MKPLHWIALWIVVLMLFSLQAASSAEHGIASVYNVRSNHGTRTASGQRLNDSALTAAHKTLPFGTQVRVSNKRNGKSVVVTINDRGPFVRGRVVDLTVAGANAIGMGWGLAPVSVERVGHDCMILPRGAARWKTCQELGRGL